MRALVTGCAGFIGSHLTEALLADGESVIGVDCFNDNYARPQKLRNLEQAQQWDAFDFVPIDLSRGDLQELVDSCDVVFHLAAEPGVRPSWGRRFDAYLRNNVLASQLLLEAAAATPGKRFVYASSSSIYGQAESFPTPEDVAPKPFSPYGTTKLAAEHLCQLYYGNHGVETVSLRYFSVYGPRQRPDMAFAIFCRAALRGNPLPVFGDGMQSRDFTYVDDIVRATRAAAGAPNAAGGIYNIGGGTQISLRAAIDVIERLADRSLDLEWGHIQEGDVKHTGADTSRALADLGFQASVDFAQGLEREFNWIVSDEVARGVSASA